MKNPLTSLDELVWKQFERVTQYAHTEYGWDKYDLTKAASLCASFAMTGMCTYASIAEATDHHYSRAALVGIMVVPIAYNHKFKCKSYDHLKEIESQTLKLTGAAVKYSFDSLRASLTLASLAAGVFGINYLVEAHDTEKILEGLMITFGGIGFFGNEVSNYFITQLPHFPATRKPFWKTMYKKIVNTMKPKPHLEPAAEPISEYSLDHHLIATNL